MASAAEQLASSLNFGVLAKATELKNRLWFTLGALIVYRIGSYVPVPGVDAAVMALVIAFVPDPAKGVAEMARAVKPGGLVSAYMWDWPEGFPFYPLEQVIAGRGLPVVAPPSHEAARKQRMEELWQGAGLAGVESRVITVERTFPDFDAFWAIAITGPRMAAQAASLSPEMMATLRADLKILLAAGDGKPVTLKASANAVKGRVPG